MDERSPACWPNPASPPTPCPSDAAPWTDRANSAAARLSSLATPEATPVAAPTTEPAMSVTMRPVSAKAPAALPASLVVDISSTERSAVGKDGPGELGSAVLAPAVKEGELAPPAPAVLALAVTDGCPTGPAASYEAGLALLSFFLPAGMIVG